jgi:hypothetical protein
MPAAAEIGSPPTARGPTPSGAESSRSAQHQLRTTQIPPRFAGDQEECAFPHREETVLTARDAGGTNAARSDESVQAA